MSLYRKGSRVQALLGAEPRGLMLLLGSPPWPHLQQGLPSPTLGSLQGPPEGQLGGQRLQRPPVQLTHGNLQWPSQAHAGPCWAGLGRGGRCGPTGADAESSTPLRQEGPAAETEASHMCKTHLVKINMGFVFCIKKKERKKTKDQ